MRTVRTSSGATAVQVVWSSRRGARRIEHLGSAHDEAQVAALTAIAEQRMAAAGRNRCRFGLLPDVDASPAALRETLMAQGDQRSVRGSRRPLGPASLVPYDGSTLYFETDQGDGRARDLQPPAARHDDTDRGAPCRGLR